MTHDQSTSTSHHLHLSNEQICPTAKDIKIASTRISAHIIKTPLFESWILNERVGGRIFVKAEVLQRTGSFKFRGAINRLAQLTDEQRSRGIVAYSSGNHAQAVALAARIYGTSAVIVIRKTHHA